VGSIVVDALGAIAIGVVIGYAGWSLLGEYRKAFFVNARAVMTLEVLLQLAKLGGPGYLAMLCLIGSVGLVAAGASILIFETLHRLGWL
jgi:hypothetical protein